LYRVLAMGGYQDHRHWRRGYSTAPHPRSKAGWLRWLRLNPPKVAPFFAAPNKTSNPFKMWCGEGDLNPHEIAPASTSS